MSTSDGAGVQDLVNELLSGTGVTALATKAAPALGTTTLSALASVVTSAAPPPRYYNDFSITDAVRASELASEFMKTAAETPGDAEGVRAALETAVEYVATEAGGLVQHAVELFVTHDPIARSLIRLPSLEQRQPNLALSTVPTPAGSTPPEDRMDWWREDPLLNDHHGHWHLVYPVGGRPTPNGPSDIGDRHGELFPYMHQQMLARYDAERLAVGLPRVVPLDNYRTPIPEGYDPGPLEIWNGSAWEKFRARPAGSSMGDLDPKWFAPNPPEYGAKLKDWEDSRDKMFAAARSQVFHLPGGDKAVNLEDLGNTEESSIGSVEGKDPRTFTTYGDHHGLGHLHTAMFDNVAPRGAMGTFQTTCRDPVFWRHHKCVDNIIQTFMELQEPHNFDDGPAAKLLSMQLTPSDSELATEMAERQIESVTPNGTVYEGIKYLTHDDFSYKFTAENSLDEELQIAVRVFLAPETEIEDRRAWIELDRFLGTLNPGVNTIEHAAEDSSVIRKPALKPADLTPTDDFAPDTAETGWCDCGWPYTLMLPRGTAEGMAFRLLAMLSSGDDLTIPADPNCTSISLCGLKDAPYPDKKPMGYPFDRRFALSIAATVAAHDNWLWRPITIRCRNL